MIFKPNYTDQSTFANSCIFQISYMIPYKNGTMSRKIQCKFWIHKDQSFTFVYKRPQMLIHRYLREEAVSAQRLK